MAATPTTRSQLQAYRFIVRRMEHALVRKDAVMLHDPMRTQLRATAVGAILAVLLLAGFALVSVFSPAADIGRDPVLLGRTSLTTYVVREEDGMRVLHPVLNLASARLVAGQPAAASIVDDARLAGLPRGPLLGIPGAPDALPAADARPAPVWTVCDRADGGGGARPAQGDGVSTTVLGGALATGVRPLADDEALFVRAPDGSAQLLFDGRRAVVDTANDALVRELGLTTTSARPVSAGLLNAVPEVAPLGVPVVPGAGQTPSYPVGEALVGDVVDVRSVDGTAYYLVLGDGVQSVPPLVAGLLVANSSGFLDVATDVMADLPNSATPIEVGDLPARAPTLLDTEYPVSCLRWQPAEDEATPPDDAARALLVGTALPMPESARVVPFAHALPGGAAPDGSTPGADGFYLAPGQGAVVQTAPGPGTRFLVTDTGIRFGIDTAETAAVLGLGEVAAPAPAAILSLLPQGPALDAGSALRAYDAVPPSPGG